MTFADFGSWAFFAYLGGCFLAFALSLRSNPDNRVLAFAYGSWISAAFAAHHLLVPHASETWHHWWYVWQAGVAAFPVLPARMLRDAGARVPVVIFGIAAMALCVLYAVASYIGTPLPGYIYFYISSCCEASQVVSMVIWSGPVVPLCVKAWNAGVHLVRRIPWTHQRARAA